MIYTKKNSMKQNIITGRKLLLALPVIAAGLCFSVFFTSCSRNNPDSSGVEYMPDMYRSPSYEDNSTNPLFPDSMTDRVPVAGTVPVGFTPDPFPNTPDGMKNASEFLKDPFPATPEVLAEGKAKFEIYCIHCHGAKGMGDGPVGAKLPGPPPAYSNPSYKNITEGEIFQTIEYGKGLMGSHASQISVADRWKIVRYVQTLQHVGEATDSTKTAMAATDTTKRAK
jgi:mono/diheme cytochrome c family protein